MTLLSGIGGDLSDALISSPQLGALAFVGGRSNGRKAASTLADLRRRHILEQEGLNTWGIWNFSQWPLLAGHLKKGFEYAKQRCTAYPRYVVQRRLLPDFLEAYPKLQLELVGEDNLIDIVKDGFDAGIRLGNFVQQDMVSLWLTPPEPYVVVGTPDFFARHGRPMKPEDLKEFRCIELRRNDDAVARWQFLVDTEPVDVQVGGALIANDVDTCLRAALKGSGLFRLPRSIAMNYVWAGLLESVLDKFSTGIPGLALYYPSRSQSLPKLRAFIDFATPRMRRDFQRDDYNISPSALRERAISPGKIAT